jgi:hypothetical protein
MKPSGHKTGWCNLWNRKIHGTNFLMLIGNAVHPAGPNGLFSVLSVSSVVNPITNEFPGKTGKGGVEHHVKRPECGTDAATN